MKKLTLRILLEFINQSTRFYMTSGDFEQLANKINKRRGQKINAQQSTQTEDEYLKIILPLRKLFTRTRHVKNTAILAAVHQSLIAGQYDYQKQRHPARNGGNAFYPVSSENYSESVYDLAFYHAAAGQYHIAHHTHEGQSSIFYMRCEEPPAHPGQILFGNMQIDSQNPSSWPDSARAQIMLQKKNIYGMMIQQAIKHALERGKKEILFQCGDANEFSQWGNRRLKPVTVTNRNYKKFQQAYRAQLKKFGERGYQQGEAYFQDEAEYHCDFVIEAGPDYYQIYQDIWRPRALIDLVQTTKFTGPGPLPGDPGDMLDELIEDLEYNTYTLSQTNSQAQILTEIKNFLNTVFHAQIPPQHTKTELAHAQRLFIPRVSYTAVNSQIDQFLHQLEYDKLILPHLRGIKKFALNNGTVIYYNSENRKRNHVFRKSDYQAPALGQTYITPTQDRYNINFARHRTGKFVGYHKMHNWYEKTLRQELKKYQLGVERVPITTIKRGRTVTAHAWKIISGIKEFKKRPLLIF